MKVRRKPSETEAILITGEMNPHASTQEAEEGILRVSKDGTGHLQLWCQKHSAWERVQLGDYAIQELDGSGWYPCARDVYDRTYEEV